MGANETPSELMSRLIRGLPEPEPTDAAPTTSGQPETGRDWFDRAVLGRVATAEGDAE